jgi:CelD/BcsL family acetyltransferase involved in cellulose biosynthesis
MVHNERGSATISPPGLPLRQRLVRHERDLADLAERWRDLLEESVRPEPMLSPDWLLPWWRIYGRDRDLCVGVYEAGDQLVGVAPMCARTYFYRGIVRFRRIEPLGADVEEGDGVCSEYLHLIVRPGFEESVCNAFVVGMMAGAFGAWDEWVLPSVDGAHPLTPALARAWQQAGQAIESVEAGESPYLVLAPSWEGYLKMLSKKRRQSLKYAQRDFEAWAKGQAATHRAVDAASLAEGKRVLQSLHGERWQQAGRLGAFSSPRFAAFHDAYMDHLLADNRLELRWLTVAGRPVAAYYGIRHDDKHYYYQAGRIIDVPSNVRLGIMILIDVLKDAIAHGLREFDFLAGQAQYKSLFADDARPLFHLRVSRPSWRERLRRVLKWGNRLVRSATTRLRPHADV